MWRDTSQKTGLYRQVMKYESQHVTGKYIRI